MAAKTYKNVLFFAVILLHVHCQKGVDTTAPRIRVYNLGVAGNTSDDLLQRVNDVNRLHPGLVIIMVGTNDASETRNISIFTNNLTAIIDKVRLDSTQVLLLKPPPVITGGPVNSRNTKLERINHEIDKVAGEKHCYLLDINALFETDITMGLSIFVADGIHPNLDGYSLIAHAVYDYLVAEGINTNRIACFGDSITWGQGAKADKTYPGILQKLLNE
jgi:lysophospholipase L1-like esterase